MGEARRRRAAAALPGASAPSPASGTGQEASATPRTALVRRVLSAWPRGASRRALGGLHGPAHRLRVWHNAMLLTAATPGADAEVAELFALIHDSRRVSDGDDPEHGTRAAIFAVQLAAEGWLRLDISRLELLRAACEQHEMGDITADPTIGCCWDADRLELSRLGVRPNPALLSTNAALNEGVLALAWERGMSWTAEPGLAAAWGLDPKALARRW